MWHFEYYFLDSFVRYNSFLFPFSVCIAITTAATDDA